MRRKTKNKLLIPFIVIILFAGYAYAHYYKPAMELKTYASYVNIVLYETESRIERFQTANHEEQIEIYENFPQVWAAFCNIEEFPEDNHQADMIAVKMAKLMEYATVALRNDLNGRSNPDAYFETYNRIEELKNKLDRILN